MVITIYPICTCTRSYTIVGRGCFILHRMVWSQDKHTSIRGAQKQDESQEDFPASMNGNALQGESNEDNELVMGGEADGDDEANEEDGDDGDDDDDDEEDDDDGDDDDDDDGSISIEVDGGGDNEQRPGGTITVRPTKPGKTAISPGGEDDGDEGDSGEGTGGPPCLPKPPQNGCLNRHTDNCFLNGRLIDVPQIPPVTEEIPFITATTLSVGEQITLALGVFGIIAITGGVGLWAYRSLASTQRAAHVAHRRGGDGLAMAAGEGTEDLLRAETPASSMTTVETTI
ncbi:general transcription factor IIF subunit 1-like [Patiria miniata]|uniref:Uncharacterized protein n=1 Tax=Patiria miniata TaxID=46514 RepID=A0A913ZSQ1_PATMI|nr:general transcription factor IIF subunit 1-like [Patiria miniata]